MIRLLFIALSVLAVFQVSAQTHEETLWEKVALQKFAATTLQEKGLRVEHFTTYRLNKERLEQSLKALNYPNSLDDPGILISFPTLNNSFQNYSIQKSNTLHPSLAAQYPAIQTYQGVSIEEPSSSLRMEITPKGVFIMFLTAEGTEIMTPLTEEATTFAHYRKASAKRLNATYFHCATDELSQKTIDYRSTSQSSSSDGQLRTYRLALACTGEYAQFHGGTTADALAAMSTTINRVNGIFAKEVSLEVQIVANNDRIVFLNGDTDPFKNDEGSQMLTANQDVCDELIGVSNYDIGHVFSTGGGGVAYLNSACLDVTKAGGVTGRPVPIGDPFDIDYVVHEMGHQFGATHTQNNDCNRSIASAFEPGSGSTIMSYSGICFPNVQESSDAYFHGYSIQQITNYTTGMGSSCANLTTTNNKPIEANAGTDYFVPTGTPYELVGSATDPDTDQTITYCWEQVDNEFATMPPESTSEEGPAFRSYPPSTSPSRIFPNLESLINNEAEQWEVLPTIGRSMEFRLTTRDNFEGGGCTDYDEIELTFIEDAGPFKVTIPSEPIFYTAESSQTVRWEVANTQRAPINVNQVNIYLSTDGGFTYPILLAENAPNDGSQEVRLPNIVTDQARIKIKSVDNIFFDISDNDFAIVEAAPDFSLEITPATASVCRGNAIQFSILVKSLENFDGTVILDANVGDFFTNYNFSTISVIAGNSSMLTINTAGISPGNYTIELTGADGENIKTRFIDLTVSPNEAVVLTNKAPTNEADDLTLKPTFEWISSDPIAVYSLEIATDPNFNQLILKEDNITGNSFILENNLEHSRTYYWRVQAENECGTSNYSTFTQFTISNVLCQTFASTDIPEIIPTQGTPEISSVLQLAEEGVIRSIRVVDLNITHSWINDLTVTLQDPSGQKALLFDQICGNENTINLTFGQDGADHANLPCPPESEDTFQPKQSFTIFENQEIAGEWALIIKDHFNLDGGQLNSWALEVCKEVKEDIPLTIIINEQNNPSCAGGSDGTISPSIIGGAAPYTINWSNGSGRLVLENLTSGSYTVTVTDDNGTNATAMVNLLEPEPITITSTKIDPTCPGANTGSIEVNPEGGKAPFQYSWGNGENRQTINNLSAGLYDLSITDANNCQVSMQFPLNDPKAMELSFTTKEVSVGSNGAINLSVTGGRSPYTFAWSNNVNSRNLEDLEAGAYQVTVTDANGCTQTGQTALEGISNAVGCKNISIQITLDNYGEETTWDIKNEAGTIFGQGGPFSNFTREEVQTANLCLAPGCYDFSIYDIWGDGICCAYGNGAFQVVEAETGVILVTGSKFAAQDKTTFCVPTNEPESGILSYCGSNGKNTVYEWIEAAQINDQVFQTGSNGGYFNNENPVVDVVVGSTIQLAFTPGFGFNPYSENWQVWIDWNRDGDLEDRGEQVFFGSGDRTVRGTVVVPSYAAIGNTKMRIAMKWGDRIGPCESFNWGEVEDFALNILPVGGLTTPSPIARLEVSEPISFKQEMRFEEQINLFPNPAKEQLFVNWQAPLFELEELVLYNSLGHEITLVHKEVNSESRQAKLQISNLPNGLYLLVLKGNGLSITKDFVIAR